MYRDSEPTAHIGEHKIARRTLAVIAAAALAVSAACSSGNKNKLPPKQAPAPISAEPPTTVGAPKSGPNFPSTSTTSPEQKVINEHNKEVTDKVRTSVDSRMKDLPEKIIAFAQRHNYQVDIYETSDDTNIPPTIAKDIYHLQKGTVMNLSVQSKEKSVADNTSVQDSYSLSWYIRPDGSRKVDRLYFYQYDHTGQTTSKEPGLSGFRPFNDIAISKILDDTGFGVFYDESSTGRVAAGPTEPTGKLTVIDPAAVESKLNAFYIGLDKK